MRTTLLGLCLLLTACATPPPKAIREAPAQQPTLHEAQTEPERFAGASIRWGGRLLRVHNRATDSLIEVLSLPLNDNGKPIEGAAGGHGRFLVRIQRFIDPLVYEEGRLLTVAGTLEGVERRKIGAYDYPYPRVKARSLHLWPPAPTPAPEPWPWYYDPWFHPYPWPPYY